MATMTQEPNVLLTGWVTTKDAAKAVGMTHRAFVVWRCRHSKEVTSKLVGRNCIVNLEEVIEARRK